MTWKIKKRKKFTKEMGYYGFIGNLYSCFIFLSFHKMTKPISLHYSDSETVNENNCMRNIICKKFSHPLFWWVRKREFPTGNIRKSSLRYACLLTLASQRNQNQTKSQRKDILKALFNVSNSSSSNILSATTITRIIMPQRRSRIISTWQK